jgi:hypothetical protein
LNSLPPVDQAPSLRRKSGRTDASGQTAVRIPELDELRATKLHGTQSDGRNEVVGRRLHEAE